MVMLEILPSIIGTVMFLAFMVATVTIVQLVFVVPRGRRLEAYNHLGMWRFAKVREMAGPPADPLIRRFKTAVIVAVCGAVTLAALSLLLLPFQPTPAAVSSLSLHSAGVPHA